MARSSLTIGRPVNSMAAYRSSRAWAFRHKSRTASRRLTGEELGNCLAAALAILRTSGPRIPHEGMSDFIYAWAPRARSASPAERRVERMASSKYLFSMPQLYDRPSWEVFNRELPFVLHLMQPPAPRRVEPRASGSHDDPEQRMIPNSE